MTSIVCTIATIILTTLVSAQQSAEGVRLELRVFDGSTEVTSDATVSMYAAGKRDTPIPITRRNRTLIVDVQPGFYDVQASRARDGRTRAREQVHVMRYPDEGGEHLEVVNFKGGFGVLQFRTFPGGAELRPKKVSLHPAGDHTKDAGKPLSGKNYLIFVVPAGSYDLSIRGGEKAAWMNGIEVLADRTQLTVVGPDAAPPRER
jgi:hypothetical protein